MWHPSSKQEILFKVQTSCKMLLSIEHVEKSDCGKAFDIEGKPLAEKISVDSETKTEPSPIPHIEISSETLLTASELPPLPFKPSPLHRDILPTFTYPAPEDG